MKTILACLIGVDHAEDVLSAAVDVARRTNGHLIGMHPMESLAVNPSVAVHMPDIVVSGFRASREQTASATKALFERHTRAAEPVAEWRAVETETATAARRLVETALACDLVVMARGDMGADGYERHDVHENVIRRAGRPVLLVPRGYRGGDVGSDVVIGWSPTREAARAVHDAVPLMRDGARASIVTITRDGDPTEDGALDLAAALDRHGISAEVVRRAAGRSGIADALRQEALERGADLIVTGAFGHSRFHDFVVGAVTLDLMNKADVPVLFSR